jgi:hypothetical protein
VICRFVELLKQVQIGAGPNFTGIGLILCDAPDTLPILPIHVANHALPIGELSNFLARISQPEHELHDGFHIISSHLNLVRIAQYFSPPIVSHAVIDRSKRFGGRYLAALFGSALPHVRLTGIASSGFGVAVFKHAREIVHEAVDA